MLAGRLATIAVVLAAAPAPAAPPPWEGAAFAADPGAVATAAAALPRSGDDDLEVLLQETTLSFDALGRATRSDRLVWRAHTRDAAERWARVQSRWAPWHQERPEIRARVVDAQGDAHDLDPATLSEGAVEDGDGAVYSDDRVLRAPLPALAAGVVVEELFVERDREPMFSAGTTTRVYAGRPARRWRLRVEAPVALPVRHAAIGDALPGPTERIEAGRRVLAWDVAPLPKPRKHEPLAPPERSDARHVAVGTGATWAEVGRAYAAVLERQLSGAQLRDVARRIVPGSASREEAAARIAAFVAERLRYTGLEFGAASIVPTRPAEVLQRSYGDCKDLSLLVVALLRALGHDAHVALLRASWGSVSAALPGLGEFDHAIVYLPGRRPMWLDPTAPDFPAGELPAHDQGRLALVADGRAKELVRTPESTSADNRSAVVAAIQMTEDGPSSLVVTRELTGGPAARMRAARRGRPADKLKETDERLAKEWLVGDALASATWEGIAAAGPAVRARLEVRGSRMGVTNGATAVAVVGMKGLFEELPALFTRSHDGGDREDDDEEEEGAEHEAAREAPVQLHEAFRSELRYVVSPPPGYRVKSLPEPDAFRVGNATYEARYAALPNGTLEASYRFDTGGRRVDASDVAPLREKIAARLGKDAPRMELERTSDALLAEGRGREAIAELRRLAALHPVEASHRADLAYALTQLGVTDAARREGREAVALEPKNAWALRALAWSLEHDPLGRHLGPGSDVAGAVEAMRRARDLEPKVLATRNHTGWLLTHDARGVQYGEGAPLEEAIAEYRYVHDTLGKPDADESLAEALLRAGRPREALVILRPMKPGAFRDGALLAAATMVEGPGAGVAEALKLDAAGRGRGLEAAAFHLIRARRYEDAAALLQNGSGGTSSAATLRARAAVLRRAKPWEKVALDERSPAGVVPRMLSAVVAPDPVERLAALAPASARTGLDRTLSADAIRAAFLAGVSTALAQPLPPPVLVDLAMALVEVRVEGEAGTMNRVRATQPGGKDLFTMFAVEEGGTWRIAAFDDGQTAVALGAELGRLARAERLDAARRVLSWARAQCGQSGPSGCVLLDGIAPAGRDPASREDLLRAAALLAATGGRPAPDDPKLEALAEARAGADPQAWRALTARMAEAHFAAERWTESLALAREIRARDPAWEPALWMEIAALGKAGRTDEIRSIARARLAAKPGDRYALDTLADVASRTGDLAEAERWMRAAIAAGAEHQENELAWTLLYRDPAPREAIEHARRGTQYRGGSRASAHTLATAHAALCEPSEALETLRGAAGARGEVRGEDWVVIGRVAECYGLLDDGAAAYRRVPKPAGEPRPRSTWKLAQGWLERLERTRAGSASRR